MLMSHFPRAVLLTVSCCLCQLPDLSNFTHYSRHNCNPCKVFTSWLPDCSLMDISFVWLSSAGKNREEWDACHHFVCFLKAEDKCGDITDRASQDWRHGGTFLVIRLQQETRGQSVRCVQLQTWRKSRIIHQIVLSCQAWILNGNISQDSY